MPPTPWIDTGIIGTGATVATIAARMASAAFLGRVIGGAEMIDRFLPAYEEEVQVRVVGNKNADINDLYFLAIAVASGKVRNLTFLGKVGAGVLPPSGMVQMEYNLVNREVVVHMRTRYGGMANLGPSGVPVDENPITQGPNLESEGAAFDIWSHGIPLTGIVTPPKKLKKYVGKPVITAKEEYQGKPVVEPAPPGDSGHRGTHLELLVSQLLGYPCDPVPQPPTHPPIAKK